MNDTEVIEEVYSLHSELTDINVSVNRFFELTDSRYNDELLLRPMEVYNDVLLEDQKNGYDHSWLLALFEHVEDFVYRQSLFCAEKRFNYAYNSDFDWELTKSEMWTLRYGTYFSADVKPLEVVASSSAQHPAYVIAYVTHQWALDVGLRGSSFGRLATNITRTFAYNSDFHFIVRCLESLEELGIYYSNFTDGELRLFSNRKQMMVASRFCEIFVAPQDGYSPWNKFTARGYLDRITRGLHDEMLTFLEQYNFCVRCEDVYLTEDMMRLPNDDLACDHCYDIEMERLREEERFENGEEYGDLYVNCYSYRPSPLFQWVNHAGELDRGYYPTEHNIFCEQVYGKTTPPIFMGVELETTVNQSYENCVGGGTEIAASPIMRDYEFLYAKSDCSVSGPEIVSHPATLAAHKKLWSFFPFETLTRDYGWRAWNGNNAGIHVHISRNSFSSDSHLARFGIYFGHWSEQIIIFAGRNSSYASFAAATSGRNVKYAKGESTPERYSAINYENANTVEVRVFRSSLRYETVISYLEFLHGLVRYSREKTSSAMLRESTASWQVFVDYLRENNYENAVQRITERGC